MDASPHQKPGSSSTLVSITIRSSFLLGFLATLLTPVIAATSSLPPPPSYVFLSSRYNDSLAYLLLSNETQSSFVSVNLSTTVDASDSQYSSVLLEDLPFQSGNYSNHAWVPVVDHNGSIKVHAGNCHASLDKSTVWYFHPDDSSSIGNGTWDRLPVNKVSSAVDAAVFGPNHLAAGFAYAATNTMPSTIYAFGGMCPSLNSSSSSSSQDVIATANYSQSMLVLSPQGGSTSYSLATTGDRAPPIPEAGFTVTPLQPTHATTTSGSMWQSQNFLLIGGHTNNAFINMSEFALFSLPQQSWSFITVDPQTTTTRKTELAVRDDNVVATVEPRSGHTAVLSSDGSKVVIFGGWVGDQTVPAEPQLAVLELGAQYGGSGDWAWTTPSSSSSSDLLAAAGIYGHGAAMLPGGVMMIAGGYTIPRSSSSSKRSTTTTTTTTANSQVLFYNLTSGEWAASYTNPSYQAKKTTASSASGSSLLRTTSQKAGLGVGVGLGVAAIAAVVIWLWLFARKRRSRRQRDDELRKLAIGAQRAHFWNEPHLSSSYHGPMLHGGPGPDNSYPWSGNSTTTKQEYPSWRESGETAVEATSLLVDMPSPTKSNRANTRHSSVSSRSYRYSEYRKSDLTGDIHPIDEREEDEANLAAIAIHKKANNKNYINSSSNRQGYSMCETSDPFDDADQATIETPIVEAAANAQAWLDLAERLSMSAKSSDRTNSNLSDKSATSVFSARSETSLHSARDRPPSSSLYLIPSRDSFLRSIAGSSSATADSFSTALTSLSTSQAEGDHLLSESPTKQTTPASATRASEWIGSVRRALTAVKRVNVIDRSATTTAATATTTTFGVDRRSSSSKPYGAMGVGTGASTGANNPNSSIVPRRAVSASAELFRRKQGARDWGADPDKTADLPSSPSLRGPMSTRDDFALLDSTLAVSSTTTTTTTTTTTPPHQVELDADGDWDVEAAAEGRRVQVTFTVPREKLRVVNATAGDLDNLSDLSISRNTSVG
ncbi:hypothetical protein ASPZODRAFT_150988 [Penicilliopsis zonata CBS 506.65]|uniref:Uncharacterized protein n=1 Tax=Penicilliopsis zonata CBS 506.65 TaxID=1073090 RepID=A0A1L9SJS9_9EURO|nr:hypothetical protein ASPZODRAFT_150988 [Penicilliopsis zonata CBS 506.65]OJJ47492.1 hypothetical protein ASPZODRAFT_150988 [Penicilliopsis zonata CBS 506.65]